MATLRYFDRWLSNELANRNITTKQFAEMTGYSETVIRLWKAGKQVPRYEAFYTCIECLGYELCLVSK